MSTYKPHSLLNDGVPPGLGDDQSSPADDNNVNKVSCVAGELENLSLFVCLRMEGKKKQSRADSYIQYVQSVREKETLFVTW